MSLETNFNTTFVANLAYKEKQIQQNYRPIIGIHKWFARRPGTLFRALMLSEYVDEPLEESFYKMHDLKNKKIADPFMGGGIPVIEANRLGIGIIGVDINPMSYWIVKQSLAPINLFDFQFEAEKVINKVEKEIGDLYTTNCILCGNKARVKYFIWTKQVNCNFCGTTNILFPNYNIAKNERHTHFVWFCPSCEKICEITTPPNKTNDVYCNHCGNPLPANGNTSGNSYTCKECNKINEYNNGITPLENKLCAIEYHCDSCKKSHQGRFFKTPDNEDYNLYQKAVLELRETTESLIPDDEIPLGDETARLHRWGFHKYKDLFNARQLLSLNTLLLHIKNVEELEIRNALSTIFSDSLRYNNMLCRYDTWALKCQDIFSVHGYPTGILKCETNLLGIPSVGSGGIRHFIKKYIRAKEYCKHPYEVKFIQGKKKIIPIVDERINAELIDDEKNIGARKALLKAGDSRELNLIDNSLDGVFTDPPYFDNIQYSELMDFCYIWLRKIINSSEPSFRDITTKNDNELTINYTLKRDITDFTEGLSSIFTKMASALKPDAPLVFTYHHNNIEAYLPIAIAILDSGLSCTITLVSPAEMSASIHINGTKSSIIDSIFVCRKKRVETSSTYSQLEERLLKDVLAIQEAGIKISKGDIRCIAFGHLTKDVINNLSNNWQVKNHFSKKIKCVKDEIDRLFKNYLLEETISTCLKNVSRR